VSLFALGSNTFSYRIEKPRTTLLLDRLRQLCQLENVHVSRDVLLAICEMSDGDIRSSLHTLEFLKAENNYITADVLASGCVGTKNISKDLFSLWNAIFYTANSNSNPKGNLKRLIKTSRLLQDKPLRDALGFLPPSDGSAVGSTSVAHHNNSAVKSPFEELLQMIEDSGDLMKVLDGCFENYLSVGILDPHLTHVQKCLDWLAFSDHVEKEVMQLFFFLCCSVCVYMCACVCVCVCACVCVYLCVCLCLVWGGNRHTGRGSVCVLLVCLLFWLGVSLHLLLFYFILLGGVCLFFATVQESSQQLFQLYKYLAVIPAVFHRECRVSARPSLTFPKAGAGKINVNHRIFFFVYAYKRVWFFLVLIVLKNSFWRFCFSFLLCVYFFLVQKHSQLQVDEEEYGHRI